MYKQGDIVLVPFPFTDLTGEKVRPALVLSNKEIGNDVTLCFVSSIIPKKILDNEIIIKKDNKNFKNTGFKTDSLFKVTKIATLERKVILGKLGNLDYINLLKVKIIIKKYFDL
jgi:mRNA interferase MazF